MIETVALTPDDWRVWRELRRTALGESPAAFCSTLAEWSGAGDTEARWRARLADVALNLVLRCDGEPAGMVSAVAPAAGADAELISLWVAPAARGRGVGDEAVRQVLAWVQREHPGSATVLSVMCDNDHAHALYRRNGFRDVGTSPDQVGQLRMRRQPQSRERHR